MGVAPSGFEQQFQDIIFYAGPVIQLAYWLAMIVAALWAVTLLKRWVDFQTGDSSADMSTEADSDGKGSADDSGGAIKVEEFVE